MRRKTENTTAGIWRENSSKSSKPRSALYAPLCLCQTKRFSSFFFFPTIFFPKRYSSKSSKPRSALYAPLSLCQTKNFFCSFFVFPVQFFFLGARRKIEGAMQRACTALKKQKGVGGGGSLQFSFFFLRAVLFFFLLAAACTAFIGKGFRQQWQRAYTYVYTRCCTHI
jgi:hypothetical protein